MNLEILFINVLSVLATMYIINCFYTSFMDHQLISLEYRLIINLLSGLALLTACLFVSHQFLITLVMFAIIFGMSITYLGSLRQKLILGLILGIILFGSEITVDSISMIAMERATTVILHNGYDYLYWVILSNFLAYTLVKLLGLFHLKRQWMIQKHVFMPLIILFPFPSLAVMITFFMLLPQLPQSILLYYGGGALLILLIANGIVFYLIEKQMGYEFKKQESLYFEQQLHQQQRYYRNLYEKQDTIRRLSHDMDSRMLVLETEMSEGKNEKALNYIQTFRQDLAVAKRTVTTGYPALDTLLTEAQQKSKEQNIDLKLILEMGNSTITIDSMDLVIILDNLLKNATEAISQIKKEKLEIIIHLKSEESHLYLSIKNPISAKHEINTLKSTKSHNDFHGYGLQNVRHIVQKNHGYFETTCDNGWFHAFVELRNN